MASKKKHGQTGYERFKDHLYRMHNEAIEIMDSLNSASRQHLERFFEKNYKGAEEKEHYWSLKKLYVLAMYIPMFLQIGIGKFDGLIYVDTHAGPGLTLVGGSDKDLVLGSPLLAIRWPKIIAKNLSSFRKIERGFDRLFLIEKDRDAYNVLNKIINDLGFENVEVKYGDANKILPGIRKIISREYKEPLILMFVDPFGSFETQIEYNVFKDFVKDQKIDLIYNVMSSNIARGITSMRNSREKLKAVIEKYWGGLIDICKSNYKINSLCGCYIFPTKCELHVDDVVKAYDLILRVNHYLTIEKIPVAYKGHTLYHLLIASKQRDAQWINNYIEYLREKSPHDYETLKKLWFRSTGRQRSILDFMKDDDPKKA